MELHLKTGKDKEENQVEHVATNEYPCLSIFLSILENEYQFEKNRSERIDTKAVTLMTIIVALITVYVPILPIEQISTIYTSFSDCCAVPIVFSIFLLIGVIALITAVLSAYNLTKVYKPTEYKAVNIEFFNTNEKLSRNPAAPFEVELIDHFQNIILENSAINAKKAEILSMQFNNVILVFALLSISAIGTLICVGI